MDIKKRHYKQIVIGASALGISAAMCDKTETLVAEPTLQLIPEFADSIRKRSDCKEPLLCNAKLLAEEMKDYAGYENNVSFGGETAGFAQLVSKNRLNVLFQSSLVSITENEDCAAVRLMCIDKMIEFTAELVIDTSSNMALLKKHKLLRPMSLNGIAIVNGKRSVVSTECSGQGDIPNARMRLVKKYEEKLITVAAQMLVTADHAVIRESEHCIFAPSCAFETPYEAMNFGEKLSGGGFNV